MLLPERGEACICLLLTMTDIGRVVMLEGREADGSSQAGAGASLGSHSAVAWPGSPVSVGGLTSVHWSHMTHVRPVWAELTILR